MADAIVIQIPNSATGCFIVMPFAEEGFGELFRLILVATAGYTSTSRADISPKVNFVDNILNSLRSANIIICVCSPEGSGKPNPNVMYELGIAHALGKPTIILTDDIKSLPIDIEKNNAIEYKKEDIVDKAGRKYLINLIRLRIEEARSRSTKNLIDSSWEGHGISLASAKHRICLLANFLDDFRIIISFEDKIQTNFQPISSELGQLWKFIDDIVTSSCNDIKRIRDFMAVWPYYRSDCKGAEDEILNYLRSDLEQNDEAFGRLLKKASDNGSGNLDTENIIKKAQECYESIKEGLIEYSKLDHDLLVVGTDLDSCLRNLKQAKKLIAPISQLLIQTKSFLVQSHNLISNLIKIFEKE